MPSPIMLSSRAAARLTSMIRPRPNGPRSLMRTTPAIAEVRHTNLGSERQCAVRSGEPGRTARLAARGAFAMIVGGVSGFGLAGDRRAQAAEQDDQGSATQPNHCGAGSKARERSTGSVRAPTTFPPKSAATRRRKPFAEIIHCIVLVCECCTRGRRRMRAGAAVACERVPTPWHRATPERRRSRRNSSHCEPYSERNFPIEWSVPQRSNARREDEQARNIQQARNKRRKPWLACASLGRTNPLSLRRSREKHRWNPIAKSRSDQRANRARPHRQAERTTRCGPTTAPRNSTPVVEPEV